MLADVRHGLGRAEEARSTIHEALELGERTGLHYWDAELNRLKGTFVLPPEPSSRSPERGLDRSAAEKDAESCFLAAIEIARRQQAKACELRAAMSLSRLWHGQGKTRKAHALLSQVYGWFTEGFETPDLIDAKTLLEELAARR